MTFPRARLAAALTMTVAASAASFVSVVRGLVWPPQFRMQFPCQPFEI